MMALKTDTSAVLPTRTFDAAVEISIKYKVDMALTHMTNNRSAEER